MIKVVIVDDHKIIRDGLRALLKGNDQIEVVGEGENGNEAITFLSANETDVVLMDLNMPEMDGFETTGYITEKFPGVKVLILSMVESDVEIYKALEAGAKGYILKSSGSEEIIQAIKDISSGNIHINSRISLNLLKKANSLPAKNNVTSREKKWGDVSKRELEVLMLIAEGYTNEEIADKLFTSRRTIESHRKNLIDKLKVKNSAQLVKTAIINGLITI